MRLDWDSSISIVHFTKISDGVGEIGIAFRLVGSTIDCVRDL